MHFEYAISSDSTPATPACVGGAELSSVPPFAVLDREAAVLLVGEAVVVRDRVAAVVRRGDVVGAVVVVTVVLAAAELEALVLTTFATVGLCEPPPHPATRTPFTSAAAASRRDRGARFERLLSCMRISFWSVSGRLSGSTRHAVSGWFRPPRPSAICPRGALQPC
jgi:hypothetical protein